MTNQVLEDAPAALEVENSIVPKEILAKLRESFPRETHETKTMDDGFKQTGVKPAYVIERLNSVLGIEGWDADEVEIREKDNHVATKVKLTIYMTVRTGDIINKVPIAVRTQWGSSRIFPKSEYGDVLKSAYTNGLCKCASMIDVAHEAYKGLLPPVESTTDIIDVDEAMKYESKPAKKSAKKEDAVSTNVAPESTGNLKAKRKELLTLFTKKGLTRNDLQKLMMDNFKKNESRELAEDELVKLVEIVKSMPNESHSQDGDSNPE